MSKSEVLVKAVEAKGGQGTADPIIEVRGLTKVYRVGDVEVHALRGVDLEIERRDRASLRCFIYLAD